VTTVSEYETAPPGRQWRWTATAAMASFLDAGSITAGSAALVIWEKHYSLSTSAISMIGAFSPNAISAGVGALVGGWICDRYGRKKIYSYDLIGYIIGILIMIWAPNTTTLVIGYMITGFAVGVDVPASWTLISEIAPARRRGRLGGLAQVCWYTGPVLMLGLSIPLASLGFNGSRILFGILAVAALITWWLRHGVGESVRWQQAASSGQGGRGSQLRDDLAALRSFWKPLLFLTGMYGIYNLSAGVSGFYMPFLYHEFGITSNSADLGLQCFKGALSIVSVALIFMPFVDRWNRRWMFGVSIVGQALGILLLGLLNVSVSTALIYVILGGVCSGFGVQSFYQLWSGELFPTRVRATAQGVTFAVVRIGLGIFSFFIADITKSGFRPLALIMFAFYAISGIIGLTWGPRNTQGRSLEDIHGSPAGTGAPVRAAPLRPVAIRPVTIRRVAGARPSPSRARDLESLQALNDDL
jgi:MFS transporter, SP family, inositol transporter